MNATELIKRGAKYYPEQTAVIYQGEQLTYDDVYRNANRLANVLLNLGLQKGRSGCVLAGQLRPKRGD